MPPTHFLLIEQPRIAEAPRSTMLMPAADLAQQFSEADRARLALGLPVQVGSVTYTDLLAFHDAHRARIEAEAFARQFPFAKDARHRRPAEDAGATE